MKKDENKMESRRDFLKTAGKFAVYTPPALMIMSNAKAGGMRESCCILNEQADQGDNVVT